MESNVYEIIIFMIGLIALAVGSYTDLKKREVADWVNYGLVFTGLGLSLIFSAIFLDYRFFVSSLFGVFMMLLFGLLTFYSGQWGGGDAKMIIGLGALLGIPFVFSFKGTIALWSSDIPSLFSFLVYILIVGAIYGLVWALFLAFRDRRIFFKDFSERISTQKSKLIKLLIILILIFAGIILLLSHNLLLKLSAMWICVMVVMFFYLYHFIKSVETCCMIKHVEPEELTEGEWINKVIRVKGKYITGPKDLGISKEQIAKLILLKKAKKYNKKIEIKIGIPFVPSFLIAYLLAYFVGIGWLGGLFL